MRYLSRFCCGCAIFTGVQVIGYLNIVQIVFSLVINNLSGIYYNNVFLIFPFLDLFIFFKMLKKDSLKLRRKFFVWSLVCVIVQDLV